MRKSTSKFFLILSKIFRNIFYNIFNSWIYSKFVYIFSKIFLKLFRRLSLIFIKKIILVLFLTSLKLFISLLLQTINQKFFWWLHFPKIILKFLQLPLDLLHYFQNFLNYWKICSHVLDVLPVKIKTKIFNIFKKYF